MPSLSAKRTSSASERAAILRIDLATMDGDGDLGGSQLGGRMLVGEACHDEGEYLTFARREPLVANPSALAVPRASAAPLDRG